MRPPAVSPADEFWAAFLGCEPSLLDTTQTVVVPRPCGEKEGESLYLLKRGAGCVVSVMSHQPARLVHAMMALAGDRPPEEVFDKALLRFGFGTESPEIKGPVAIGLLEGAVPEGWGDDEAVRQLHPTGRADSEALRRLFGSGDIADWDRSGVEFDHDLILGASENGDLVAVASAIPLSARLHGAAVFTHPAHRGRGWARRVLRSLCARLLADGRTVQMAAPDADGAALALARSLGFRDYGQTLAVAFGR